MRSIQTRTWRPRLHTLFGGTVLIATLALPFMVLGQTTGGAATAQKEMIGTIAKRNHHQLWVNMQNGKTTVLTMDDATVVYESSGTPQKVDQLMRGQQIKASYDMKANQRRAIRIDVQRVE